MSGTRPGPPGSCRGVVTPAWHHGRRHEAPLPTRQRTRAAGTRRARRGWSAAPARWHPGSRPGDIAVVDRLDLDAPDAPERCSTTAWSRSLNARRSSPAATRTSVPSSSRDAGVVLLDERVPTSSAGSRTARRSGSTRASSTARDGERAPGRALGRRGDHAPAWTRPGRPGHASWRRSPTTPSEFLRREQDLLLNGEGVPELRTRIDGRPVVVVVRGARHDEDLRRLRRFIREQQPVLVGVDGGAERCSPPAAARRRRSSARRWSGRRRRRADRVGAPTRRASRSPRGRLHADRSGGPPSADRLGGSGAATGSPATPTRSTSPCSWSTWPAPR